MKRIAFLLLITATFPAHAATLPKPDADDGGLQLPPGFRAFVASEGPTLDKAIGTKGRLRGIVVAPNGDLYGKSKSDGLIALHDNNGDGRFDVAKAFGKEPGSGVKLHGDWLYYSTRTGVYRYAYKPGQLVPQGEPETIVEGLPAEKDHDAKAFDFDEQGRLLVEIGSPYNVYSEPDRQFGAKGMDATEFLKTHGGFWRFDANKPHQKQADGYRFSTGHRHSLALAFNPISKQFFMAMMGRDNMNIIAPDYYDALDNAERVSEEMHLLKEGVNIGWPYSYWDPIKQARMVAPEFGGDNRKRDDNPAYDKPVIAFPGHWAPIQMAYYSGTQFPERYRGGMFVAFHGSWNRAPRSQAGYKVVFVPFGADGLPTGQYETFADGFSGLDDFVNSNDAKYRPMGLAIGPDGSLYIGEDRNGRVWRVIYTGEKARATAAKPVLTVAPAAKPNNSPGAQIYNQVCAACHMPDGRGAGTMNPGLSGSNLINGEPRAVIRALLYGSDALPAGRPPYSNKMPAFGAVYDDAQMAQVLSYIRSAFGNVSGKITPEMVAAERARKP